jgi:hypothetical protein
MRAYRDAVAIDAKLSEDAKLRANVALAADSTGADAMLAGLDFQAQVLGEESAKSRLADLASTDKRLPVRKQARALADEHGATARVDQFTSHLLDLEQEPTCELRRGVIAKLLALRDKRAIKPIKRARDRRRGGFLGLGGRRINGCLVKEADAAIALLKSLPD